MSVFTIGQNPTLDLHLKWCAEILAENEANIAKFKSGEMRIRDNRDDMTAQWIAELERHNEHLRRVLKDFEPAKFQSRVK